ncbi:MAG: C40 family peptidase [Acidimicrobiales bacterium]
MKAVVVIVLVGVLGLALVVSALGDAGVPALAPSGLADAVVPADYLSLDEAAAATCPGLSWAVLAAIASVESGFGSDGLPGVHSGLNAAGIAEGPMQFEPASFAEYDHPVPPDPAPTPGETGPPSPYDPTAAVYAAARMLCANGVGTDPAGAIYAYNHSAAYVSQVLDLADSFGQVPAGTPRPAGTEAANWALSQVGQPYVWGGADPASGFDCSGLVRWAYARAGVVLPRVAQAQFDAGPAVPLGAALVEGDLVFFGPDVAHVDHVGIYIGAGLMVDAPHAGASVRIESYAWGDYLGATAPGASG